MSRTRDDSRRDNDDDTSPTRTGTQAVVQKDEPTLVGGGGKASNKPGQQLLTSPAIACTTTANNDQDDGDDDDDEQTTCSSTRKALNDFHIRSTPPSPASKSSGPAVPSALTEATDTAAAAATAQRRRSSSSQPSKSVKQHSSVSGAQPPHPHNRLHRENFLVFTRILFKCLSDHPSPEVRIEAKRTIMDCTRRNRMGDPGYHPLIDAIEARLRHIIGDIHWKKALEYLDHYMTYRRIGGVSALTKDGNKTDPPVSCR